MGRMSAYTGKAVTWDQALNSKLDTFPQNLAMGPDARAASPQAGRHRADLNLSRFDRSSYASLRLRACLIPGRGLRAADRFHDCEEELHR